MSMVYNYLLESYPVKKEILYPVHKRSELKKVYYNIINQNKSSPLYKVNLSKENQEYAFGIKEAALELKSRLSALVQPENPLWASKAVSVSDERVLEASLLQEDTQGLPENMTLAVTSLASPQKNTGKDLMLTSQGLPTGTYEFHVRVGDQNQDLTYLHERKMENQEALTRIAKYLNQTVPGIRVSVEAGGRREYGRLSILSGQAGKNGEPVFEFSDSEAGKTGLAEYFGMNRIEERSIPAGFALNEVSHRTATNVFTLEGKLRITLKAVSEKPVSIRLVSDSERILAETERVLDTYNSMIRLAHNRTRDNEEHYRASRFLNEMKGLEKIFHEELEACGIRADDSGLLSLEDPLAVMAAQDQGMESLFTRENGFIARLMDKAEAIAINPMEYLDKKVLTYPNREARNWPNPYITSMYSGLFFSSYC
ncbi:flagellar hook-associated protein 2 [Anaerotaenia torta]|uniref:hypothetical protein n=1 Tax=Anaerotaenia torta TaxID=433293 RepID=UPI003D215A2C